MNEPMNFPDVMWRRWTGLTYKISQASWNPHNLQQSSVQILFDSGLAFQMGGVADGLWGHLHHVLPATIQFLSDRSSEASRFGMRRVARRQDAYDFLSPR